MKFRITFDPAVWNRKNAFKGCLCLAIVAILGVSFVCRAKALEAPETFSDSLMRLGLFCEGSFSGSYSLRNAETGEYCNPSNGYQFTVEAGQRYELYADLIYSGVSSRDSIACAKVSMKLPREITANKTAYLLQNIEYSNLAKETSESMHEEIPLAGPKGENLELMLIEEETRIIGQKVFYPEEDFSVRDLFSGGVLISNGETLNGIIDYSGKSDFSMAELLEARKNQPELTLGDLNLDPADGISVVRVKLVFETTKLETKLLPQLVFAVIIAIVGIAICVFDFYLKSREKDQNEDEARGDGEDKTE